MKISAIIEVQNRNHAALSGHVRKRAVYSTLSIGKLSQNGQFKIQYCNKSMTVPKVYDIVNNVQRVFTKFINEGKSTIRFKNPPDDMMITHQDGKTLMSFLNILSKVLKNETIHTTHVISSTDSKVPTKPKTIWTLETNKEYWNEFPRTLTTLMASNIQLDDIGNKMRPLLQLKILNLSKNTLTELPEYLGNLPLGELNLSHNQLTYQSNWSWMKRPCIQKTLHKLVLSNNKLMNIPDILYKFHNLVDLQLADVKIKTFPVWICSSFPNLRSIDLSYNLLAFVPANIKILRKSATLVVPNVGVPEHMLPLPSVPKGFPSLKSLAANCVYPFRSKLTSKTCPESLLLYVYNSVGYCKCGQRIYAEDIPLSGIFKSVGLFNIFYDIGPEGFIMQNENNQTDEMQMLYQECLNKTKRCR